MIESGVKTACIYLSEGISSVFRKADNDYFSFMQYGIMFP